jgi:hypothetical protein
VLWCSSDVDAWCRTHLPHRAPIVHRD